ncbi:Hypothetical protein, putative [Bodo saltans]|uniref:Uncharacterized protein n=1 Tax=Bodo saltans TaxID=75058 RepID=A0A0S4J210_BODSA|nr:Hypothetical protein, putative [Bodo saltans]|eukprot:CUG58322.1 Hypothetical protein, putative [Bodo saltans]
MLRHTLALRLLRQTPIALFEVRDVRERVLMERLRSQKLKTLERAAQVSSVTTSPQRDEANSDEVLAQEAGLMPPTSFTLEEIKNSREVVSQLVREQREKRLAKREAFLTWQAGQREKGSATRLARSAKKAERWRQLHHSQVGHKIISTALHSTQHNGRNTNNDSDAHMIDVLARVEGRLGSDGLTSMHTTSDILNRANMKLNRNSENGHAMHLTLSRGGLP